MMRNYKKGDAVVIKGKVYLLKEDQREDRFTRVRGYNGEETIDLNGADKLNVGLMMDVLVHVIDEYVERTDIGKGIRETISKQFEGQCGNKLCEKFSKHSSCNCNGIKADGVLYEGDEEKWRWMLANLPCDKRGHKKDVFITLHDVGDLETIEVECNYSNSMVFRDDDKKKSETFLLYPSYGSVVRKEEGRMIARSEQMRIGGLERIGKLMKPWVPVKADKDAEDVPEVKGDKVEVVAEPVYGWCPVCGAIGVTRARCKDGMTTCQRDHKYKACDAILDLDKAKELTQNYDQ